MDIQSCVKASLLALGLLSLATSLPHLYSCLRTFLVVSLPSVASAVTAPKCLFVFSNIIVVFLVGECKLSHGGKSPDIGDDDVLNDQRQEQEEEFHQEELVMETALGALVVTGASEQEEEGNMAVVQEEEGSLVVLQEGHHVVQMDQDEGSIMEVRVGFTLEEEEESSGLPAADELNRRVEDFIARFNMERQLEARMLVCCR